SFRRSGREIPYGSLWKARPVGAATASSRAAAARIRFIMPELFDALVLGGGPSGATAALLLARAGWSVAVIEKSVFPRRKVCGEYVSGTSLPLFRDLGIEQQFS